MMSVIEDVVTSNTFFTVISGVLVFVLCQLFNEYFLKPIQDYKKIRSKIAYSLTLYAYLYMNPVKFERKVDNIEQASYELRRLAAEVDAMIELRPFGNVFIPKREVLARVSRNLIGLSNGFYGNSDLEHTAKVNDSSRKEIYMLLNMKSHKEKIE